MERKKYKLLAWFKKICNILIADKLPYLFTLLIALIAYQSDHFINSLSHTPIIKYDFNVINQKDSAGVKTDSVILLLKNLSSTISFKNLNVDLKYRSENQFKNIKISDPDLIPISPSPILPDSNFYNIRNTINCYKIPQLQPNAAYQASFKIKHNRPLSEMPSIYLNTTDNVWLTQSNFQTWILEYQVPVNIILIIFFIALTIIYANFCSKNPLPIDTNAK